MKLSDGVKVLKLPDGAIEFTSAELSGIRMLLDEIERRAEVNMLKTSKLEGMHYAAIRDVRKELGIVRGGWQRETRLQPRQSR